MKQPPANFRKKHRWFRRVLLAGAVSVLLLPDCGFALDPAKSVFQYNCRTWTRQNGLPADGINAIAQTLDGYLWLGTAEGLVSFDGIEFKSHRLNQLQSQIVTCLSSSRNGGLWMGMERGAFAYYDGQNMTNQGREDWGGVNLNLHAILETRDQALWLGAETQPARLSKERLFQAIGDYDTTALMQDSKGRVWIGTAHRGLFWWANGILTRFPDHAVDNQEIRALAEDKDGQIWIGTDWGPLCYDSNFLRKDFPFPWYPVCALLLDREGTLWMGTTGAGLIKYQNGTTTSFRKQDGLADDKVSALAEDQEGNLWVGTRSGLSQFTDFKIPTFTKTEGVPAEIIVDVSASRNGGLWLATGHGFTYFDGKGNSSTTLLGLTNEYVNRIFEAKNGDIYLINGYKDIEIFRGTNVLARYPNDNWPSAFGEDDTGVVVSITTNLFRIGPNYFSPFPFAGGQSPELGWIFNIAPGRDGSLWLATGAGICRIKDGVFKLWSTKDSLPGGATIWVGEDNEGVVWAGEDKGIARIKDGKVTTVNRDQGLFDNIIYSAIPDNHGRLYVDSSRGFFSLDTRNFDDFANGKTDRVTCTDFTGLDGVKSSDRFRQNQAGCRTLDGRIWFPTAQGVVMIDPDRIKTQSIAPRIYIQSTRADGTELKPGEKTVRPGKGDLQFQYAGLSYIAPRRIHYRYMLQGYDQEWVDVGTRRAAFYTNLKPGRYRFLVQACNEDGVWSTGSASVDVKLLPHFYQTAWFISLAVAAFIAALFAIYAWRLKLLTHKQQQLQKSRDLLEAEVASRTRELATANASLQREEAELKQGTQALKKEIEERKRMELENKQIHRELLEKSRQAGMAEIATNVLHNVGNVLNSVNVSASLVVDNVKQSKAASLAKVAAMLREHERDLGAFITSDAKGRQLPGYLGQLSEQLLADQKAAVQELDLLVKNIEHIMEIVTMQQNYARVSGVKEIIDIRELVEDGLRMNSGALARHRVEIIREYEDVPPINVDKHRVLQILVNLIRNAKYACDESERADRRLTVRVANGEGRVIISISDNGIGIPPENLSRVFNHGFTTRKAGHGFGLHSGALAAKEMGGSLVVQSNGIDHGATFTLELPRDTDGSPHE